MKGLLALAFEMLGLDDEDGELVHAYYALARDVASFENPPMAEVAEAFAGEARFWRNFAEAARIAAEKT